MSPDEVTLPFIKSQFSVVNVLCFGGWIRKAFVCIWKLYYVLCYCYSRLSVNEEWFWKLRHRDSNCLLKGLNFSSIVMVTCMWMGTINFYRNFWLGKCLNNTTYLVKWGNKGRKVNRTWSAQIQCNLCIPGCLLVTYKYLFSRNKFLT